VFIDTCGVDDEIDIGILGKLRWGVVNLDGRGEVVLLNALFG